MAADETRPAAKEPEKPESTAFKWLNALATPVMVGIVGFLSTSYLNQRQTSETNARVYADLLSRREEADTSLRKEMFNTVLQRFLETEKNQADRILKLELLAYNFHESLDLSPLFLDVVRRIDPRTPEGERDLGRLVKIAREINAKQMEALLTGEDSRARGQVEFAKLSEHPEGLTAIDSKLRLELRSEAAPGKHPERRFVVEVLDRRLKTREVRVRLTVSPPGQTDPGIQPEVDILFWLAAFDFPGIDNTRLSNGERCAVVLSLMDQESAQIQLVYFPGTRASLRDKLYVEDVLEELLHLRRQQKQHR